MSNDTKITNELLGSELAKQMVTEMGLQNALQDEQARALAALGRSILNRVLLEILKALPESDHTEFKRLFDAKDVVAIQEFLQPRIPDFERFIQHEAMREYEATKTRMHEIAQGI